MLAQQRTCMHHNRTLEALPALLLPPQLLVMCICSWPRAAPWLQSLLL
jgi:hypothetical protein